MNKIVVLIVGLLFLTGCSSASSSSVDSAVKLAEYEHCLALQNQALGILLPELKAAPSEGDQTYIDQVLELTKLQIGTNKIEWMEASLGVCASYKP